MSDINRVQITYASKSVSNKTKNVIKKTVRIAVKLPQSNEDTCPEYNFKDELDAAKKRGSSKNSANGGVLSIMEDDDSDVKRIAREMEEKYGKSMGAVKKKRRNRKDDYADIGMGYDESDPFIDNTDGYDEIIPQNVTTAYGGFYINCGALEFKTDTQDSMDSSSSSSGSSSPASRNGKRTNDSEEDSDEGAESSSHPSKKPKLESGINGMQKAIKKKLFSSNKIIKKKRSSNIHKKTVKDLLKEKRLDLNMSVQSSATDQETPVFDEGETRVENGKNITSSITDAIESVVKAADEINLGGDRLSSQTSDVAKPISLPENLPNNIAEIINKLKLTASNLKGSNKFTDEINSQLLSLERKSKCLGKPSRIKVYEHLSHFIKVEKQVLMQHGNQLLLKDEEKKIKSLLQKLKVEIDKVMPSIISNYEKECELVLEKRSLLQQQNQEGEEKKRSIGRPKRKFQWNDQTRKYLKDTAITKKKSYLQQGKPKELWEEELANFLKNNVLQLWPEGWMTMTTLTKVCNKLFSDPKTANITPPPSVSRKETKITATNVPSQPSYPSLSAVPPSTPPIIQNNKVPTKTTNAHEKTYEAKKPKTIPNERIVDTNSKSKTNIPERNLETIKPRTSSEKSFDANKPKINLSERNFDSNKPKTNPSERHFEVTASTVNVTAPATSSKPQPNSNEIVFDYSKPKTNWNERNLESNKTKSNLNEKSFNYHKPKTNITEVNYDANKADKNCNSLMKEYKETILRDFVYKDYYKQKEKIESMDVEFDKKNNNGNTFFKIDYDKPIPSSSSTSTKPMDLLKDIKEAPKLPNVSIIELDNPNCFDNILPRSKPKPKSDYDFPNPSNLTIKSIPSESSVRARDRSVITEYEKPISVNSSFEDSPLNVSGNDDIQKVMEHLKNLQKMSSPIKTFEGSSSSNTGFSQKSPSVLKNNIDLMASSFQDEFQKQLFSALGHLAPSTSKSNYKCS